MKLSMAILKLFQNVVAPFTGAWIEIDYVRYGPQRRSDVAPFTGAWIEIKMGYDYIKFSNGSHPSRVRGLKYAIVFIP